MSSQLTRDIVQAPAASTPATLNDKIWARVMTVFGTVRAWPWWLQVAALYLASRLYSFAVLAFSALHQATNPWGGAHPDYAHFVMFWDSEWYERIFQHGYPSTVPRDHNGSAKQNEWAFYPLFPFLLRGISTVTGLGFSQLGIVLAPLFGLGAALVIFRLFRRFTSVTTSMWGLAFVLAFPVAPVLQVPYAESLNLLLLAAAMLLVVQRSYLWAIPVVLMMDLSRPVGVPFAALAALHFLFRLLGRASDPFPLGERLKAAALVGAAGIGGLAWPMIAWAVTGEAKAYTDTETAWRGGKLVPLAPWPDMSSSLFGPVAGPLALSVIVAGTLLYLNSKAVRRLGLDLRIWCASYLGYLAVFLNPQTSTFRLLLPLFPLALGAAFISRSRAYRACLLVMFLSLQVVWVNWLWVWTRLPGGGSWPP